MIRINSALGRITAVFSVLALNVAMVPAATLVETNANFTSWVAKTFPKKEPLKQSKILSAQSMAKRQGRSGLNPYAAGQAKWDASYKGVNLMNGNYTTSGTDLTFEGGYGIPVNVTRSYSANNGEEGPLGYGWTLSVDVRSTAGGLMKSGSAPVRSVPVNFKERPSLQVDANAVTADGSAVQPIQAVLATDAGGKEETIQRDADGILSTPPWDKNKIESEYETLVKTDGSNVQIMTKNWVHTPEGTVYVYEKKGSYTSGSVPFDQPTATPEDSNVLKITTATDRHGNVTTYTYDNVTANAVSFTKLNGVVSEAPLKSIQMPNGHKIDFTWTGNRITKAKETVGFGTAREVVYGYDSNGRLTSVTTPGGKTTTYGYSTVSIYSDVASGSGGATVLSSITGPNGLTETIKSAVVETVFGTSTVQAGFYGPRVAVYCLEHVNGLKTWFGHTSLSTSTSNPYPFSNGMYDRNVTEMNGSTIHFSFKPRAAFVSSLLEVSAPYQTPTPNDLNGTTLPCVRKYYSLADQNLMEETSYVGQYAFALWYPNTQLATDRKMQAEDYQYSRSTSTYNFMGNPLTKTVYEYEGQGTTQTYDLKRTAAIGYAYWGANKYYQQKAVKDQAGRYSYTDYYDSSATTGKKGQTYKVYDDKRTTFVENTGITIPTTVPATPSGNYWKYRLEPQTDTYSAKFDYDTKGRTTQVWKIQSTDTTPWTYVQTVTSYGADSSPIWGAATQVVEDYGGIARTTQTLEYDGSGRAIKVQDASGKIFKTNYDLDGVIQSIQRLDSGTSDVVTYTYGTSGVTNGSVLSVTDNLSGVSQTMTYFTTGSSVGQIASVTETNGSDVYSSSYTYDNRGARETATYVTQAAFGQSDTVTWKYADYTYVGEATQGQRAFQTLVLLNNSTGNPTSEEFHYAYDTGGRLRMATYGMTPQSWTPGSGASYYDASHLAATRGRSYYEYDGRGRMKGVYNWWDTLQGNGTYSSSFIRGNECDYELTGSNRGLKTTSRYLVPVSGQPLNWATQRAETYSYDADLDYLVGADYDDGLANETTTWSYDAAGNRISDSSNAGTWSYDNLNRMTASPGLSYSHDILGNRISKGATSYAWDVLNRMTGIGSTTYAYRADGMRVSKLSSSDSTAYRYDGQMGTEDVERNSGGTITALTRHGLGARGLDVMSRTTSSGNTLTYPLYDAHGNGVGQLARNGSSFTVSDERTFDAWGGVRSGATSDKKGRHVANLGHKQDDESGLIYMRARYYEPTSGRFTSEDPTRDGHNWYGYAAQNPINLMDFDGKKSAWDFDAWYGCVGATMAGISLVLIITALASLYGGDKVSAIACIAAASACAAVALLGSEVSMSTKVASTLLRFMQTNAIIGPLINAVCVSMAEAKRKNMIAGLIVALHCAHLVSVIGALGALIYEDQERK